MKIPCWPTQGAAYSDFEISQIRRKLLLKNPILFLKLCEKYVKIRMKKSLRTEISNQIDDQMMLRF
jgi:hypothetical protein